VSRTVALVHPPSHNMDACQRTFVPQVSIDLACALAQHKAYCNVLADCGCEVIETNVNAGMPDCAFIEDTAIVLDELAILGSMGAASRRSEPAGVEPVLRKLLKNGTGSEQSVRKLGKNGGVSVPVPVFQHAVSAFRPLEHLPPHATLEGGDVLRVGRRLLVGQSRRSNRAGIDALAEIAGRYGYQVTGVPVRDCLHLKTACTALPDGRLLVNPAWIDERAVAEFQILHVPEAEPWAANVMPIGKTVVMSAASRRTADLVDILGFAAQLVDLSEFAKAEGGVTCLALLIGPTSRLNE
jgi:dimethylargininase